MLGSSLLFHYMISRVVGPMVEGTALDLHPLAFAGWVGLYITALNLLPIGQLDGGHISYAIFGRSSYWVSLGMLLVFTFISLFLFAPWVFLIVLILVFGFRHPPPMDDLTPLDWVRYLVGWGMLLLFVLTFTPVPLVY
jgi:membrane-associated protease RseP (regulator of RpoE activity)